MPEPEPAHMTAEDFVAWAATQPEGQRHELHRGELVAMAPERSGHALMKFHVARRLADAVQEAGAPCTVHPDGMAVAIDDATVYEPDASVRCGPAIPEDAVQLTDPVIVVEVTSPSTSRINESSKLIDYFRLPSVQHYLVVRIRDRAVIHHARNPDNTILTRIVQSGSLRLDPPGITLRACSTLAAASRGVEQALSLCIDRQLCRRADALICRRCLAGLFPDLP